MNKNQVKGTLKTVAGKVQSQAGELVGSNEQRLKGASKQAQGKAQKLTGDLQQAVHDANAKKG